MEDKKNIIQYDSWMLLRQFTQARIALGKTGVSVPASENLQFKIAHAFARDAVHAVLNKTTLVNQLQKFNHPVVLLHSKAIDRQQYLQRPDFGRQLNETSVNLLKKENNNPLYDICINIADGLSATAVNNHAIPLLQTLFPILINQGYTIAPLCVIEQGRVAISDETGQLLNAKISIILIGERPGLSSPDSMGIYLTYNPVVGNTDEQRNCISNIRPEGLNYTAATQKIFHLVKESLRLKISGVQLKDLSGLLETETTQPIKKLCTPCFYCGLFV
jgi:ethanolamine ammonia-lyase small subunit